jgi:Holliday junction resolvasome RuvABC ATP-dependent DNA helicase subunit
MADLSKMTDWNQLKAMLDKKNAAGSASTKVDEAALLAHLQTRVKGQDAILEDVSKLIRLQMAKQQKDKPVCSLIFLGPTGTGKTELAKEYGLTIQFVAPELIMQALASNDKVSRFGIRELERILFDMFATQLIEAREAGATSVLVEASDDGAVRVTAAA